MARRSQQAANVFNSIEELGKGIHGYFDAKHGYDDVETIAGCRVAHQGILFGHVTRDDGFNWASNAMQQRQGVVGASFAARDVSKRAGLRLFHFLTLSPWRRLELGHVLGVRNPLIVSVDAPRRRQPFQKLFPVRFQVIAADDWAARATCRENVNWHWAWSDF